MKYLSLAAMLFIMAVAWSWLHEMNISDVEHHTRIQQKVSDSIKSTLQEKYENLRQINFEKLWSENVSEDKIKVVFRYVTFHDKTHKESEEASSSEAHLAVEGEAFVEKINDKLWSLKKVNILKEDVLFPTGSTFTN